MAKPKQRAGLQKDFSAIFQGVWIPKKPRRRQAEEPAAAQEHERQINEIEQIISSMKCSKDFACFKSGFQNLCKIKVIGDGKIIECSPENDFPCEYRFSFMDRTFCKCELRYYIARNLNK